MPIEEHEFEAGKKDIEIEKNILAFLQKNKIKAFTVDEIKEGTGYQINVHDILWDTTLNIGFIFILDRLIKQGKVKSKIIDLKTYYMIK